jgi:hypothetical protein
MDLEAATSKPAVRAALCRLRAGHCAGEHQHTPGGGTDAGDPSDPMAHRDRLLQKDKTGETGDPEQVHDTAKEQEAHQEPAASQTIGAVLQAHVEGSEWAGPPPLGKKAQGRAAVPQADALDRAELPHASGEEDRATEPVARRRHHRRQQVNLLQSPLQSGCERAEAAPGREIAGGEDPGRPVRTILTLLCAVDAREEEQFIWGLSISMAPLQAWAGNVLAT